jgi:flagellar hook-associated protein 3 FlgL
MRITNNTVSQSIVGQIQQLGSQQAKLQTQVSTGQRISQPEDDPAAVGRVLGLQSEQRRISQYQNNAAKALQLSQATSSALQSIKKVSDRIGELATLSTGNLNASQSKAYATEVNQLIEQTLQYANTSFGKDFIFGGTEVSSAPFSVDGRNADGNITGVTYIGNTDQASVPLSETAKIAPGSSGATNKNIAAFLNQMIDLRDHLSVNDTAAVPAIQTQLEKSEDNLVAAMAEQGGIQARIEANQDQQTDRMTEVEKLVSSEAEVDLPSTIVKLTQTQTAYQAALQSAASIMKISLLDYIR